MLPAIYQAGLTCACTLLSADSAAATSSLIRTLAVSTFRRDLLALLEGTFLDQMLLRAKPT